MKLFRGSVSEVKRSTIGYGDNEKIVGVDATVRVKYYDNRGSEYQKSIIVHLPFELGQPLVGDEVFIGWEPALNADAVPFPEPPPADEWLASMGEESPSIETFAEANSVDQPMAEMPGGEDHHDDIEQDDEIEGDPHHDEIKQGGA